jgi:hypothetical protein
MSDETHSKLGRRGFLQGFAAVTGAISLSSPSVAGDDPTAQSNAAQIIWRAGTADAPRLPAPEAGYQSLGPMKSASLRRWSTSCVPLTVLRQAGPRPIGVHSGASASFRGTRARRTPLLNGHARVEGLVSGPRLGLPGAHHG